ncbi:hypothetical protein [Flammeovirga kamogawensis]|uniref:Tetratricopeptide repeat protein n=1 Tax=Flammeovirga kamogawensis TaxID=373891 RepID=A0ABX8GQK2_9BACT|nr:hypothetical protein [Flammeovirga kamogawensis]MBB6463100.1 hypothetical protein [Flammeovirga kamogawensis]QWG05733.1 hypothetical protein KM029_10090 [Flammeovirga kamogawensis]TRX67561.1 hypothetical protein EO216_05115 [Flammeovirga kamogawensis]
MKNLRNIFAITLVTLFSLTSVFASGTDNEDNEITKLRNSVENASANDWTVYADAAERCIELKTNLSEAYVWLDTALEIAPNARNYELKGDYLALNGANDMAMEAYRQSILLGMNDSDYDIPAVQKKLLKLYNK